MEEKRYFAVHMVNKDGEEQIEKVRAENVTAAHSKKLFCGSEWTWTGSEPWHNVEDSVVRIFRNMYKKKPDNE